MGGDEIPRIPGDRGENQSPPRTEAAGILSPTPHKDSSRWLLPGWTPGEMQGPRPAPTISCRGAQQGRDSGPDGAACQPALKEAPPDACLPGAPCRVDALWPPEQKFHLGRSSGETPRPT